MKIYFTKKISCKDFKIDSQFVIVEYLTNNGKYTIKNNKLVRYKLNNICGNNKNLGNGFTASSEIWKLNDNVFTIPYNHVKIERDIVKYKIDEKLFYIKETVNNKIKSDYFLTNYRLGDKRLIKILNEL